MEEEEEEVGFRIITRFRESLKMSHGNYLNTILTY